MRRAVAAVAAAVVLVLADSAVADEYNMRVNEIDPSAGVVELLDVSRSDDGRGGHDPNGGVGTYGEAYVVRSYDGAGNDFAAQEYTRPLPFVGRAPFVLSLPLPPGAGQVCFERPRNSESTLPLEEYRFHCMGYGEVTKPVIRRLQLGGRRLPMPVARCRQRASPCSASAVGRQPWLAPRAGPRTSRSVPPAPVSRPPATTRATGT